MKRVWLKVFVIFPLICGLLMAMACCDTEENQHPRDGIIYYTLSPNDCEELWGVSPELFFTEYFLIYDEYGDFRMNSYVDKDGNLVIGITQEQYDVFYNKHIAAIERSRAEGVLISDDWTEITIRGYREDAQKLLFTHGFAAAINMVGLQRLTKGYDHFVITLRLIDEVSGEVVFEKTFRDVFNVSNETVSNLTPRPQESASDSTEITETTAQNP